MTETEPTFKANVPDKTPGNAKLKPGDLPLMALPDINPGLAVLIATGLGFAFYRISKFVGDRLAHYSTHPINPPTFPKSWDESKSTPTGAPEKSSTK